MTDFSLSYPFPSYRYIGASWDGRLQGSMGLRMQGVRLRVAHYHRMGLELGYTVLSLVIIYANTNE